MVQVRPSSQAVSSIALRREGAMPVLAAGLGLTQLGVPSAPLDGVESGTATADAATTVNAPVAPPNADNDNDDHTETAWRIRHARKSVLKDATLPEDLLTEPDPVSLWPSVFGQTANAASRFATLFADAPISGQLNLLTSGSFDTPQQLFSTDASPRNIANVRLGAPAGDGADWAVAGALTQADISSWVVAGSYTMRAPATHRYDVGLSYSTQRYDGGNPLAVRDVTDGSRNVGTVYAYDSYTLTPEATAAFGAEYGRYDYLSRGIPASAHVSPSRSRRPPAPG